MSLRIKCLVIAHKIAEEAGIRKIEYHNNGVSGRAFYNDKRIRVPPPTTPLRLFIFAHECAHIALKHGASNKKTYIREYEAEQWAIEQLQKRNFPIDPRSIKRAKEYVAYRIRLSLSRGGKSIHKDILDWCWDAIDQKTLVLLHKRGIL